MKKSLSILPVLFVLLVALPQPSCKSLAKAAVKHWTKKQRKEFIAKCKDGAVTAFGDNTNEVCACVATSVEENMPNYEDAKAVTVMKMISMGKECLNAGS